jgi:hypothetical protein
MRWWKKWQHYMNRASQWDSPDAADPEIVSIKKIFRSVEKDEPDIGDRVWRRVRPYLHPLEDHGAYASSLWTALASDGPRFALAGAFAFVMMAGVFLTQAKQDTPLEMAELNSLTILSEARSGIPSEDPMEIIQANNGDELLQFIAYGSPQR